MAYTIELRRAVVVVAGLAALGLELAAAPVGACSRWVPEYEVFEIDQGPADATPPEGPTAVETAIETSGGDEGACSASCPEATYASVTLVGEFRPAELGWYVRVIAGEDPGLSLGAEPIALTDAGPDTLVFEWMSAHAAEDLRLTLGFRPVDRSGALGEEIQVVFGE